MPASTTTTPELQKGPQPNYLLEDSERAAEARDRVALHPKRDELLLAEAQERGDASESDRDEARPALARVDRNEQSLADDIGRQRGGRDGQWRRGRLAPRALRRLRAVDGLYL